MLLLLLTLNKYTISIYCINTYRCVSLRVTYRDSFNFKKYCKYIDWLVFLIKYKKNDIHNEQISQISQNQSDHNKQCIPVSLKYFFIGGYGTACLIAAATVRFCTYSTFIYLIQYLLLRAHHAGLTSNEDIIEPSQECRFAYDSFHDR